jgi:hypothetical protein
MCGAKSPADRVWRGALLGKPKGSLAAAVGAHALVRRSWTSVQSFRHDDAPADVGRGVVGCDQHR